MFATVFGTSFGIGVGIILGRWISVHVPSWKDLNEALFDSAWVMLMSLVLGTFVFRSYELMSL